MVYTYIMYAVLQDYDFVFSENGLVAHKNGELIGKMVNMNITITI